MTPAIGGGAGQTAPAEVCPLGVELGDVRTLFPLPELGRLSDDSKYACRDIGPRCSPKPVLKNCNLAIGALNWLAGFREPKAPGDVHTSRAGPTPLQSKAHARVVDLAMRHQTADAIPCPRAAFSELLRNRAVYGDDSGNPNLATFSSVKRISMPDSLAGAPQLIDVLPAHLRCFVEGSLQHMWRDDFLFCQRSGRWGESLSPIGMRR